MFYSFAAGGEGAGRYYDSHSIRDLRHPQSLLAYEMNGERLPILHGRPLRLRVENQLGFKHVKWISEIEFVRHFRERYAGQGGYNEDHEFLLPRRDLMTTAGPPPPRPAAIKPFAQMITAGASRSRQRPHHQRESRSAPRSRACATSHVPGAGEDHPARPPGRGRRTGRWRPGRV